MHDKNIKIYRCTHLYMYKYKLINMFVMRENGHHTCISTGNYPCSTPNRLHLSLY